MSDPILGEIRMFGGSYAPVNWEYCYGQLLNIVGNEALFSLLEAAYGGDGRNNFALPDLRSRVPVHYGQGSGLTYRDIGTRYGVENVTLTTNEIPPHSHPMMASTTQATSNEAYGNVLATGEGTGDTGTIELYDLATDPTKIVSLNEKAVGSAGGGNSHLNVMPSLAINFIIAMKGTYPQRS